MLLADEMSDDESKDSDAASDLEKQVPFDFSDPKFKLDQKNEVYRMNTEMAEDVPCELCKLLYDYSTVCTHHNLSSKDEQQDELTNLF